MGARPFFGLKPLVCSGLPVSVWNVPGPSSRAETTLVARLWCTETGAPRQLLLRTALVSKLLSLSSPLFKSSRWVADFGPSGFFAFGETNAS